MTIHIDALLAMLIILGSALTIAMFYGAGYVHGGNDAMSEEDE